MGRLLIPSVRAAATSLQCAGCDPRADAMPLQRLVVIPRPEAPPSGEVAVVHVRAERGKCRDLQRRDLVTATGTGEANSVEILAKVDPLPGGVLPGCLPAHPHRGVARCPGGRIEVADARNGRVRC